MLYSFLFINLERRFLFINLLLVDHCSNFDLAILKKTPNLQLNKEVQTYLTTFLSVVRSSLKIILKIIRIVFQRSGLCKQGF